MSTDISGGLCKVLVMGCGGIKYNSAVMASTTHTDGGGGGARAIIQLQSAEPDLLEK